MIVQVTVLFELLNRNADLLGSKMRKRSIRDVENDLDLDVDDYDDDIDDEYDDDFSAEDEIEPSESAADTVESANEEPVTEDEAIAD